MPMWCVVPLEMNEGNSLGARVQSAYKAAVPIKPHKRPYRGNMGKYVVGEHITAAGKF